MEMFSILIGEINAEVYILNYTLKMCAFDYINYPTIKLILTSVAWRKLILLGVLVSFATVTNSAPPSFVTFNHTHLFLAHITCWQWQVGCGCSHPGSQKQLHR